jgi:uncharacterized protein YhbP (UPF0306 family)
LIDETSVHNRGDGSEKQVAATAQGVLLMNIEGLRGLEGLAGIEDYAMDRPDRVDRSWVRDLLHRNRVLVLATTNGDRPWIVPLEYMMAGDLDLVFFSSTESRHAGHLETNGNVAVTVFDHIQPKVTEGVDVDLKGLQMECTAARLDPERYTDEVRATLEAFHFPVPPYAAFKVVPQRVFVPRVENGINVRYEVDLG